MEVFLLDGGSTDNTLEVIDRWKDRLTGWRSHADEGQASAINEGIALGKAPYVCWLNSDDLFLPDGLTKLLTALTKDVSAPAAYGRAYNLVENTQTYRPVWVEPFSEKRLALRCIISQPATLIRRSAWEAIGGVDNELHMVMDYDLWWRLFKECGALHFLDDFVAVNREHEATKTKTLRRRHYSEAIAIVRKHHGSVPLKWWIAQPYAVWYKSIFK
ncbi:GT2 family glycosyltransferase [Rhizobium mesoamericanum]|nr:GT2 family glycosyltransferase [Rhizobium mesoamericanum]